MKLIHRMKILLGLLQELGGELKDSDMQRLLFLYCREFVRRDEYYDFVPLAGSPYSVQAEEDKKFLVHKNLLAASEDWVLLPSSKRFAADLDFFEKIALQDLKNTGLAASSEALAARVSSCYSGIENKQGDEIILYTIGYEGLSPETYANLLLSHGVRLLVDVRRNAFSQKYGFSKSELAGLLSRVGIDYFHMPELGIESEKRQALVTDSDYEALFREYEQTTLARGQEKLRELISLLEDRRRIAITCFEADPYHCHRSRVAKVLKSQEHFSYTIKHLQSCHHQQNNKKSVQKSS